MRLYYRHGDIQLAIFFGIYLLQEFVYERTQNLYSGEAPHIFIVSQLSHSAASKKTQRYSVFQGFSPDVRSGSVPLNLRERSLRLVIEFAREHEAKHDNNNKVEQNFKHGKCTTDWVLRTCTLTIVMYIISRDHQ